MIVTDINQAIEALLKFDEPEDHCKNIDDMIQVLLDYHFASDCGMPENLTSQIKLLNAMRDVFMVMHLKKPSAN
jgi:hypothetical protein